MAVASEIVMSNAGDTLGLRPNRACRNCINIKAKCVPLEGTNEEGLRVCQRCHRLHKTCTTPAPAAKRVPRVQKGVRVRQLEERINELTSLVTLRSNETATTALHSSSGPKTTQPFQPIGSSSIPFGSTPISDIVTACRKSKCTSDEHLEQSMLSAVCMPAAMEAGQSRHITLDNMPTPPTSVEGSHNGSEPAPHDASFPLGTLPYNPPLRQEISSSMLSAYSRQEMDSLLNEFRETMSPHFPFVIIPEHFIVSNMCNHRPFLMTACIAIASHRHTVLCRGIIRDMLKYLSHQMLVQGEKSFDLVQGLLTLVAWHQFNTEGNPQLMNLVYMCQALLTDLGLNRAPGQGLYNIRMGKYDTIHGVMHSNDIVRTLEEKRAYLGFYYIHSKLASTFKRVDYMRWTEYLESCCQSLYDSPEYPSDRQVVGHVRMFQLVERYSTFGGIRPSKSLPLRAYTQLFLHDLRELQKDSTLFSDDDISWERRALGIELLLFENAFSASDCEDAHRVEALYSIFGLIQKAFDTFLHSPFHDWAHLTFLRWTYIVNFMDVLSKLCFAVVPGWDLNFVRTTYGFSTVMDRLIARLHEANAYEQAKDPGKPFTRFLVYASKLEKSKNWYNEKIAKEAEIAAETNFPSSTMDMNNMALDMLFPLNSIRDTFDWDIDFDSIPNGEPIVS